MTADNMSTGPYRQSETPIEERLRPLPKPWLTVNRISFGLLVLSWAVGNAGVVLAEWPVSQKTLGGILIANAAALFIGAFAYWTYPRLS